MIKLPIQRKIDINQLMHSLNLDDDWLLRAFPIDKDGTISLLSEFFQSPLFEENNLDP